MKKNRLNNMDKQYQKMIDKLEEGLRLLKTPQDDEQVKEAIEAIKTIKEIDSKNAKQPL
jgi:hypothetical protein